MFFFGVGVCGDEKSTIWTGVVMAKNEVYQ